jgi:ABC-2 type transport system ATP-binding protein
MAAVVAEGLTKNYAGTRALDGVDLRVETGELRGLLGPNGAGKTTLLRILLGLVRPDSGAVELLGEPVRWGEPIGEGVAGFVEEPAFYPYLSGRANLQVLAELDGGAAASRVEQALERVGLGSRAADRVGGYSSGMRQRLGIAASLTRSPRLLLLDEPTSGLDPAGVREVGGLLRTLAAEGTAVLLSSHQIGELEGLCDGFDVLSEARLVWTGSVSEMRARASRSRYSLTSSDDAGALALALEQPGIGVRPGRDGGLAVTAERDRLDALVLALGREGIAVRSLQGASDALESMFFELTRAPS